MSPRSSAVFAAGFVGLIMVSGLGGCTGISSLGSSAPVAITATPLPALEPIQGADDALPLVLAYSAPTVPAASPQAQIESMIARYAGLYQIPVRLVRRVVARESGFNPLARRGPYRGLMQIHPQTARTMGYSGPADGLFDPETNLNYGVKYLAGAYLVAGGNEARADQLYQSGYYYLARTKGLLAVTGLRPKR